MICRKESKYILFKFQLLFLFLASTINVAKAQDESSYDLSKTKIITSSSIISKYSYDPETGMYIYIQSIDDYPINAPLVLSPKEFQAMVLSQQMRGYFQEKIATLAGNSANLSESQKNLLPEVYVNSKFFQSIFGGNTIDIVPQGCKLLRWLQHKYKVALVIVLLQVELSPFQLHKATPTCICMLMIS